jgi:hypothetical protein
VNEWGLLYFTAFHFKVFPSSIRSLVEYKKTNAVSAAATQRSASEREQQRALLSLSMMNCNDREVENLALVNAFDCLLQSESCCLLKASY